jgi:hypothetical protein
MPLTVYEQPFLTIAAAAKLVKPRIARLGRAHIIANRWSGESVRRWYVGRDMRL